MRILAEAHFLQGLEDEGIVESISVERLVAAGDAACDAMDEGDGTRSVLIRVAIEAPTLEDAEAAAAVAGWAAGTLCPEHADYAG